MLTPEQIKSLKPGDPVIIHAGFKKVDNEGDIWTDVNDSLLWFSPACLSLPSEHGTSVPTPKYDPCRKFKKGDKVQLVAKNGRNPFTFSLNNIILRVAYDEDFRGLVRIHEPGSSDTFSIPYSHLELVSPIEEMEPYSIDPANSNVLFKHGKKFAIFEDDDDAQTICARLNAERRKEHAND